MCCRSKSAAGRRPELQLQRAPLNPLTIDNDKPPPASSLSQFSPHPFARILSRERRGSLPCKPVIRFLSFFDPLLPFLSACLHFPRPGCVTYVRTRPRRLDNTAQRSTSKPNWHTFFFRSSFVSDRHSLPDLTSPTHSLILLLLRLCYLDPSPPLDRRCDYQVIQLQDPETPGQLLQSSHSNPGRPGDVFPVAHYSNTSPTGAFL